MRNVLAISSATKKAYIGLKTDTLVDFSEIDANCKQSESILFEIDKLLSKNELTLKDITDIAVVVGPGSFTGVRIGIALAKGLGAGQKNLKFYPISSLDFMAQEVKKVEERKFLCVINALSGLAFVKEFDASAKPISDEKMVNINELSSYNIPIYGLDEENICEQRISLSAETLLNLALQKVQCGNSVEIKDLSPVYLRNSQAEENLKKNKKSD